MAGTSVRSTPVPGSSGAVVDLGASDVQTYRGYSLRATTTGILNIREGGSSGVILDTVAFTAPQADSRYYDPGLRCTGDLYIEIVSGVWVGSIRHD